MAYIILPNLQIIFFFICFVVESFKKIFMCHFAISSIIVYHIIIISNILDNMANCIEFRIVKGWLI